MAKLEEILDLDSLSSNVPGAELPSLYDLGRGALFKSQTGAEPRYTDYFNVTTFDSRLYKIVSVGGGEYQIRGGIDTGSFFGDYYESPTAAAQAAQERETGDADEDNKIATAGAARSSELQGMWSYASKDIHYKAPRSFIHPYALLKLAGVAGTQEQWQPMIDLPTYRRWYEIDGDAKGGYAKNPTTRAIINWGAQDERARFPYSFTDFVYCKYWTKIQNNRMITLRRYPMPVPDSVEPANYNANKPASEPNGRIATNSKEPFGPVCTAVTYFGEGTGNSLSDILKFSVGYNWKELNSDVWMTTSAQNESGKGILGSAGGFFGTSLGMLIEGLGILDDLRGERQLHPTDSVGLGPDPYSNGPYENRIIGPINVINKIYRRDRGLTFSQDGLSITFEYVSRPIAGVNNKAIMLDLLANMLTMTSGSGTFFGGAHRYRCENPAVYPMRDTYSLSLLYKGKIFGKGSAPRALLQRAFDGERVSFMTNFAKGILGDIQSVAENLLAKIGIGEGSSKSNTEVKEDLQNTGNSIAGTAGRAVTAHMLKGASIPWLTNARALLTGEPVGDWHLTIGNPMNPIAMIGNLIVDNCDFEFSNELGPDDFPISFKAVVHLKHGMGRDRDAVGSMFNRGFGRLYSLPDGYLTSADLGTKVDANTAQGSYDNNQVQHYTQIATEGRDNITAMNNFALSNAGTAYEASVFAGGTRPQYALNLSNNLSDTRLPKYAAMPWQTRWTL